MSFFKKIDLRFTSLLLLVLAHTLTAQVTLTHNVGEIVPGDPFSCSPSKMARVFDLQDFGVAENEMFVINSLEIAYQMKVEEDFETFLHFYVYAVDDNFPASYPLAIPISRNLQFIELETSPTSNGLTPVKMLKVDLDTPIHVPPNINKILVEIEVSRNPFYLDIGLDIEEGISPNSFYLASTQDETDASWVDSGDCPPHGYITTDDYGYPNSHFYLKVFGNTETPPSSCATPPIGYGEHGCDTDNDGFLEFDTSWFKDAHRRFGFVVSYFDGQGNPIPAPFPDTYTNKTRNSEAITRRTFNTLDGTCEDVKFTFTVHDRPDAIKPTNLYACDEGNGFATFDASSIESQIIGSQTNVRVSYHDANGQLLSGFPSSSYRNQDPHTQTITARVESRSFPHCERETSFDLIVQPRPEVGPLQDLIVPDTSTNGIAEFDTSNIESLVINGQTGMEVSYFDALGSALPSPLPNPFTNTTPYHEVITVRVTNPITDCFAETPLNLRISNTPIVMKPSDVYACDEGNGFAYFDVSSIRAQIIGTQTGLNVSFLDASGQLLPNFPSASYRNITPFSQIITARVTDESDPTFHEETTFDLIVNPLPLAQPLNNLTAQDDDGDGFAEFDTSGIQSAVLGSQTGMQVLYFDAQGSALPSPLPNPYTNTVPHFETIMVQVTNPITNCHAETPLTFEVPLILPGCTTPVVERPSDQYACDEGDGFAHFDVSAIEGQIIGLQTGLIVSYLDGDGQVLQDFPSTSYRNQEPYSQTVIVRVTDETDASCSSTTSFNLIVNPSSMDDLPALENVSACGSFVLPLLANGDYFTAPGGSGTALAPGDVVATTQRIYVYASTGPDCESERSFEVTILPPIEVAHPDVSLLPCGPGEDTGGIRISISESSITGGSGSYVRYGFYLEEEGPNDEVLLVPLGQGEYPFYLWQGLSGGRVVVEVEDDMGCTGSVSVELPPREALAATAIGEQEPCAGSDGHIVLAIVGGVPPYATGVNGGSLVEGKLVYEGLRAGMEHRFEVVDANGCSTEILVPLDVSVNLSMAVEVEYLCQVGSSVPRNLVHIRVDPSLLGDVLFALDGDFTNSTPEPLFRDVAPGRHSVFMTYRNGCIQESPFEIVETPPLVLELEETGINTVQLSASGGGGGYEYRFEEGPYGAGETFRIRRSGTYEVAVRDAYGCEVLRSVELEFLPIEIPNFFTPDGDGINDAWGPRNMTTFPNAQTKVFDRYGRQIAVLTPGEKWYGLLKDTSLPSGDYWYILELNDREDARSFMGSFTLYR
ncbi:MAG: T9SS type B sorting domain-containing protein [Bacteroidota bacterium]